MDHPGAELPGPWSTGLQEHRLRVNAAARDVVRLASFALSSADAVLLGLVAERFVPHVRVTIVSWSCQLALGHRILPAPTPPDMEERQELTDAAEILIGELACRWPANAMPPHLGVVTDGRNLLFSAKQPSPLSPAWFAPRTLGSLIAILPMKRDGILAHLATPVSASCH